MMPLALIKFGSGLAPAPRAMLAPNTGPVVTVAVPTCPLDLIVGAWPGTAGGGGVGFLCQYTTAEIIPKAAKIAISRCGIDLFK